MDSYWLMVGYFDAYLFALASIADMASKAVKARLDGVPVFRFFKALRNVSAHHSVLAATVVGNKFPRPFRRNVSVSVGSTPNDSARLIFRLDVLRQILDAVEQEYPREKKNLDAARNYITDLEARRPDVFLEDLMYDAVAAVKAVIEQA